METSSSTKGLSRSNGLTRRQKDLLKALKDEPTLRKAYLQSLMNEDNAFNISDKASSSASTTKPAYDQQDLQDPNEFQKDKKKRARKGLGLWQKQGPFVL